MRFLNRWRCVLMALVLLGVGNIAVALVRSPGYRSARAYARIHEGMSFSQAADIIQQFGGRFVNLSGKHWGDEGCSFGDGDRDLYWLELKLQRSAEDEYVAAKRLQRLQSRSFGDWFASLLERWTTSRRKQ